MSKMKLNYKDDKKVITEENKDGTLVLTFPLLQETNLVKHGFSTRIGGVSEGMFSSMNLSFARNDKEEHVRENFQRFAKAIHINPQNMVFSDQTHTANVRIVTNKDRGKGYVKPCDYTDVDGLITNEPGICLVTFYADCVPIYIVDPVKKVIALLHSGWRGTVGKIAQKAIWKMQEVYDSQPEDMLGIVAPSICRACYEVDEVVVQQFDRAFDKGEMSQILKQGECKGKYQLDLWRANQYILLNAGLKEENINVTNLCTCCNSEILFSHRASQGKRGNLAAFLALREEM